MLFVVLVMLMFVVNLCPKADQLTRRTGVGHNAG